MAKSMHQWGLYGALFGLCFPVIAAAIRVAMHGVAGSLDDLHTDPLLWIIGTAPAFLGAFAALGGRQQDKVRELNAGLEDTVRERTADLALALEDVQRIQAAQDALLEGLEVGLVSSPRTARSPKPARRRWPRCCPAARSWPPSTRCWRASWGWTRRPARWSASCSGTRSS